MTMELSIPKINYVGLLQEKCTINRLSLPEYSISEVELEKKFKCTCFFQEWTTEGIGFSKRCAKQVAAQAMLNKIEKECMSSNNQNKDKINESEISKLHVYSQKEKKELPLFSEMKEEEGQFVYSCTFDNFTGVGKGDNKKIAKENSAKAVVKHFNIHTYIENIKKTEERQKSCKNPSQQLHELCQLKKLKIEYEEEKVKLSGQEAYIITCKVGDLQEKSAPNSSKKLAKTEAVSLLLNLLSNTTPDSSPLVATATDAKRTLSEYKEEEISDEEPLLKHVKYDK